jgi:hypothetical protein
VIDIHVSLIFVIWIYLWGPGWLNELGNCQVGLPNNSYKPITNTAWVRSQLCKLQKGCTRLAVASDKVYQLLANDTLLNNRLIDRLINKKKKKFILGPKKKKILLATLWIFTQNLYNYFCCLTSSNVLLIQLLAFCRNWEQRR